MEITGKIEMMSGLQTRSFPQDDGTSGLIEYVEVVINNGLERICAETMGSLQAKALLASGLRAGDDVTAMLVTWCKQRKTNDGRLFYANVTKIAALKKVFDFNDTRSAT